MMRINRGLFCVLFGASVIVACSFGGSQGNEPQPDASNGPRCGDGTCSPSEVNNCPADCGNGSNGSGNAVCGNGQCETTKGETSASCPTDCSANGSGSGSGSGSGAGNCPSDVTLCFGCAISGTGCPAGLDMNSCLTCLLGGLGSGGGACNFDGVCDPGEDMTTCPTDCP